MLVDIRHSPSEHDKVMARWLVESSQPFIVVATKKDKIPRGKLKERLADISQSLQLDSNIMLIPFSSETKEGREEIMNYIESIME